MHLQIRNWQLTETTSTIMKVVQHRHVHLVLVAVAATPTGTCTTGVGYWKTSQSCSEVPSGSYGKNPTTPLLGTLYRCTSTNNWQEYYTPYQYPHPLRSGDNEALNAPKGFKLVN